MKRIITIFIIAGILMSCNSSDKTKDHNKNFATTETVTDSSSKVANEQLVAIQTNEALIATALMAAPEESRAKCKVIGYNIDGEFVTLREGDNEFIVLADDLNKPGFSAACYHKDLEPFMARGRELKAEGKTSREIFDIREVEVKSGKLQMGKPGSTLHIYYGAGELYSPNTFNVAGAQYRYVVYLPFATSQSTGLPEKPIAVNHPWIMNPGTHRAHIMISPLPEDRE
ncbi:hypothetical protein [Psychroserpens sp.]|uniref:hypothetical protein n=1 Tax=Psychroserpens sp. TaxID=2020870 RepID=UPI00385A880C